MPEVERQVDRRFAIGSIECAVLCWVLVGAHVDMQCGFDDTNGAFNLNQHSVARATHYFEPIGLGETKDRIVVLLGGAKPCCEFCRCQEMAVLRTRRTVDLAQKALEA